MRRDAHTNREEPGLENLVGYRLKQTRAVLRSRMDEALRPLGPTTPRYVCLELLARTPATSSSEPARGAFVTRQTMSELLRGLQSRGPVARAERPSGGRALPVELTPDGRRLLDLASERIGEIEQRMVSGLTVGQRRALHEAPVRCAEALED